LDLVGFQWPVCLDGYRLTRSAAGIENAGQQFKVYAPLKVPALFKEFTDTRANPEGMLDFCNVFGLPLGAGQNARFLSEGGVVTSRQYSASTSALLAHHAQMRRALNLFEKGDSSELIKQCNWSDGLTSMQVQLSKSPDGRLTMLLTPPDLLRAMWFQFAQHACSGTELVKCRNCNKPFVVGTGTGRRRTAEYCDKKCGMAAWLAKQGGIKRGDAHGGRGRTRAWKERGERVKAAGPRTA
jgi:hypothetical protein